MSSCFVKLAFEFSTSFSRILSKIFIGSILLTRHNNFIILIVLTSAVKSFAIPYLLYKTTGNPGCRNKTASRKIFPRFFLPRDLGSFCQLRSSKQVGKILTREILKQTEENEVCQASFRFSPILLVPIWCLSCRKSTSEVRF